MKRKFMVVLVAMFCVSSCIGCGANSAKQTESTEQVEAVVESTTEVETELSKETEVESTQVLEIETEQETEEATTEEAVETWYSQNADLFTPVGPAYYEMIQYTADVEAGIMEKYSFFDAPITSMEITEESNGDGTKQIFFKYSFDISQWSWDYERKTYTYVAFDVETGLGIPSSSKILEAGLNVEDFSMYLTYEDNVYNNDTVEDAILTIHCPEDFDSAGLLLTATNIDNMFNQEPPTMEGLLNSQINADEEEFWKEKGEDFSALYFTNYQP